MKRIYYVAMLAALLLSSCGQAEELNTSQTVSSGFDSYICFSVKSDVTDDELDEIARIIENRVKENYLIWDYKLIPEYDTDSLRFEFDYIEELTEHFAETITDKNILEFHKGDGLDGELLLTNDNVESAYNTWEDYGGGDKLWYVVIELDEAGSRIFADATGELAGTGTPISVWLDNEIICAPMINTAITTGNVMITGNFDDKSSDDLAKKINSLPLTYDVIIDTYEFGVSE